MAEEQYEQNLILAAEDCDQETFDKIHKFSRSDDRIISKLIAHGPVLLQGGRGSGKSALLIEAFSKLFPQNPEGSAIGIYLSLRHLPLLRSSGKDYETIFCGLLIERIRALLREVPLEFNAEPVVGSIQSAIAQLSSDVGKRIVLMFDDAAHIGRETSLAEFFDIFRTLSSSTVSCKATIYPGVTQFGTRFDVYNDATVVDVTRREDQKGFDRQFLEVIEARFPKLKEFAPTASDLNLEKVAGFLGQSVLGNMRAFVFLCNAIQESAEQSLGFNLLTQSLLDLTSNYYWPLLEEVSPKLGKYTPMVEPARQIANTLFQECGTSGKRFALVHRDVIARLSKPFEILEYVGFTARRDVSRGLKSGGRGTRYALSPCILLEFIQGKRLTSDLFDRWRNDREEPFEFHVKGDKLAGVLLPEMVHTGELAILQEPIEKLGKSNAYPYGLTQNMMETLKSAEINTVRDLAETPDDKLDALPYIGPAKVKRIRNVVGQAVWM
ncbi:MAG TPA: hypothetical protein VFZ27_05675 [Terriglobia bacterium]|nr:hypothetical protein [Terriglobia bacterium]